MPVIQCLQHAHIIGRKLGHPLDADQKYHWFLLYWTKIADMDDLVAKMCITQTH